MPLLTRRAVGLLVPAVNVAYNGSNGPNVQAAIDSLAGESVLQASRLSVLEKGSSGFLVTRSALAPVSIPAGPDFTLFPLSGLLDRAEPPDPGIWTITANGTIQGSNDVASRYVHGLTVDYADDASANVIWKLALVRGKDLHTATPTLTGDRVVTTGRTNVANSAEPDGRTLVLEARHPDSGDLAEYGLMVQHNQPGPAEFTVSTVTWVAASIGPGTV